MGGRGSKMQTLQLLQYVLQGLLQQEGELSIQQMWIQPQDVLTPAVEMGLWVLPSLILLLAKCCLCPPGKKNTKTTCWHWKWQHKRYKKSVKKERAGIWKKKKRPKARWQVELYLTRHHVKRCEVWHRVLRHCGRGIFISVLLPFFGEHLFDHPPMWHFKWCPILVQNSIRICNSTHQWPLKSSALCVLRKSLLPNSHTKHTSHPQDFLLRDRPFR